MKKMGRYEKHPPPHFKKKKKILTRHVLVIGAPRPEIFDPRAIKVFSSSFPFRTLTSF